MEMDTHRFIAAVQCRPCLWKLKDKMYNIRDKRRRAWEEIAVMILDSDWYQFTEKEQKAYIEVLHKRWKNLRDYYVKEQKREKSDNSGPPVKKRKRLPAYFEMLRFLDEVQDGMSPSGFTDELGASVSSDSVQDDTLSNSHINELLVRVSESAQQDGTNSHNNENELVVPDLNAMQYGLLSIKKESELDISDSDTVQDGMLSIKKESELDISDSDTVQGGMLSQKNSRELVIPDSNAVQDGMLSHKNASELVVADSNAVQHGTLSHGNPSELVFPDSKVVQDGILISDKNQIRLLVFQDVVVKTEVPESSDLSNKSSQQSPSTLQQPKAPLAIKQNQPTNQPWEPSLTFTEPLRTFSPHKPTCEPIKNPKEVLPEQHLVQYNQERIVQQYDSNTHFLLSLLPEIESMTPFQQMEFKVQVMNVIKNIKYPPSVLP